MGITRELCLILGAERVTGITAQPNFTLLVLKCGSASERFFLLTSHQVQRKGQKIAFLGYFVPTNVRGVFRLFDANTVTFDRVRSVAPTSRRTDCSCVPNHSRETAFIE